MSHLIRLLNSKYADYWVCLSITVSDDDIDTYAQICQPRMLREPVFCSAAYMKNNFEINLKFIRLRSRPMNTEFGLAEYRLSRLDHRLYNSKVGSWRAELHATNSERF